MGAQFQTIKSVFNGGEMSPLMDGRTDSEKYATGCRLLENFIVRSYGGVFKRPGIKHGAHESVTFDPGLIDAIRIIPFRRNTTQNYALVFKENLITVYNFVSDSFNDVASLVTTYSVAEIEDLHYVQLNDVMYLTVATEHPKIITRASDGTWSIADVPFQFAPALDPPDDAVTMKIDYDANDWVSGASYVIGDFVLQAGLLYRCITANSDAVFTGAKWTVAIYDTPWNVGTAHVVGEVVEYFGSNYFCITAHTSSSANRPGVGAQWVLMPFTDYRLTASSATFDANEVGSTWLLSPGSTNRLSKENFGSGAGTVTSAAIFIQGTYLARTIWTAPSAPTLTTLQLQESLDRINFTTVKEWRIETSVEGTISYTAEAPNTGGWYRFVAIRDTGASAATTDWMIIEPATAKLDIPFNVVSYVSTTQVRGIPKLAVDSLIPNEVIGSAFPVWRKGAFSITRGYPRTCAFHDSRLFFASTATEPMRIWGSQLDDFYTFLTGSLDTSGIDVTLAATQANDIQWLASFKRTMVIGTTGEEWTMDSGDQDNALTPSNVRLRRWSRYGSAKHQPVLSGDGLLWLTRDNRLREFAYVFEKDGYSAPEMTLLAEHIPSRSNVVGITYSQSPDPIVWLIHADGTWSGFTYDRDNNITAWHRHRIGGGQSVLGICALYSASTAADSLIFLVDGPSAMSLESISGERMIAAMSSATPNTEVWCMDSYASDNGIQSAGTLTFTGIQAVTINPNFAGGLIALGTYESGTTGAPLISQSVLNGSSWDVSFVSALASGQRFLGFPFTSYLIPNRMEIQLRDGSAQMKRWRVSRGSFRVWRSYHGHVFQRLADVSITDAARIDINDIDTFPVSPEDTPTTLGYVSGQTLPQALNFNWGNALDIVIASKHPTPFNLLGMILEVEVESTSGAGS
jgi:hypothetical protein